VLKNSSNRILSSFSIVTALVKPRLPHPLLYSSRCIERSRSSERERDNREDWPSSWVAEYCRY